MEKSQNGWPAAQDSRLIDVQPFAAAGVSFPAGVRGGDVAYVLGYVARQFHLRVQKLGKGCWGYAYRANRNDPNALSNHSSATALDINAPLHPNGKAGTFTPKQVAAIHAILAEVEHAVRWGGDYRSTKDEMHFEINVSPAALKNIAARLRAKQRAAITNPPPPWYHRELHYQDPPLGGADVKHVQLRTGFTEATATGFFDLRTKLAVQRFQERHSLPVTGRVDLTTARALDR